MKVIGLTGGIATGKSLAAAYLKRSFFVPCIDADQVNHEMLKKGEPGYRLVVQAFGSEVCDPQGQIDRRRLGAIVFNSPEQRRKLNAILHPLIMAKIDKGLAYLRESGRPIALVSAALLLEEGFDKRFDDLLIILADPEIQKRRLIEERQESEAAATKKINSQWTNAQREAQKSYFKIFNNGGPAEFEAALHDCWQQIIKKFQIR